METQMGYHASLWKKAYDKETVDPVGTFHLSQIQVLPVSADMIRQATQRDPILSRVMGYIKQGWTAVNEKELKPFYKKKDELTMQDGCLISGSRIVIPPNTSVKWTLWRSPWSDQNKGLGPKLRMVARNRQSNRARVKTVQRLPTHPEQSQNCTAPLMGAASTPLAAHLRLFCGTIIGNDVSSWLSLDSWASGNNAWIKLK